MKKWCVYKVGVTSVLLFSVVKTFGSERVIGQAAEHEDVLRAASVPVVGPPASMEAPLMDSLPSSIPNPESQSTQHSGCSQTTVPSLEGAPGMSRISRPQTRLSRRSSNRPTLHLSSAPLEDAHLSQLPSSPLLLSPIFPPAAAPPSLPQEAGQPPNIQPSPPPSLLKSDDRRDLVIPETPPPYGSRLQVRGISVKGF